MTTKQTKSARQHAAATKKENEASTSANNASSEAVTLPILQAVSKTRICIKNIPSKLSNEKDLRQYLLKRLSSLPSHPHNNNNDKQITITDCRIIQPSSSKKRKNNSSSSSNNSNNNNKLKNNACIAFVGFALAEHAQLAIQQLHRTYYQTTKLHVEMAILPSSNSTRSTNESVVKNNVSTKDIPSDDTLTTTTSSTPVVAVVKPIDKKKQAFLAAMGIQGTEEGIDNNETTSSNHQNSHKNVHRQFWSNDDTDMIAATTTTTTMTAADDQLDEVDDDSPDEDNVESDDDRYDDEDDENDDADPLQSATALVPPALASSSSNSAMDFLRSKQVNVSDLPEDGTTVNNIDTLEYDDAKKGSTITTTDTTYVSGVNKGTNISSSQDVNESVVAVDDPDTHFSNENQNDVGNDIDSMLDDTTANDNDSNIDPHRIFLRNLPFVITEDELRGHFEQYGEIVECHIAIDDQYRNKGYAFISYATAASAYTARRSCDQHDFHGRLLHILPAQRNTKTATSATNNDDSKNGSRTYKDSTEEKRRANAIDDQKGWMSTHVRDDAVLDNLAVRLGIRKGDLFNVKDTLRSGDAAVRLALGETAIIDENRKYFRQYGIDMETLVSYKEQPNNEMPKVSKIERSTTSLLVKNLPFDTTYDDLKQIFIGNDLTILLPPSRTIAVIEYKHPNDAKLAFRKLAYRRFKSVPLYLEWAPLAAKKTMTMDASSNNDTDNVTLSVSADVTKAIDSDDEEPIMAGPTATLYIKNLNFTTTEDQLREFLLQYDPNVRTVRIPKKVDTVKHDRAHNITDEMHQQQHQSMGFGFVELSSKESAQALLKKVHGAVLDDHALELHISSSRPSDSKSQRPSNNLSATKGNGNKKIIVRNVPFQATRKELLQLFGSFGTLKKVRLPKKFDGSHRGFAFVEYLTAKECVHAMNTLSKTHLYGRHLVLEWAEKDEVVDDLEFLRSKAERDVMTSATTAPPRNKKIRFD